MYISDNGALMELKVLANTMQSFRKKFNMSQGELATHLGFTQATVSRIESAKQVPPPQQVKKILDFISATDINFQRPADFSDYRPRNDLTFVENYFPYKYDWNCYKASLPYDGGGAGGDVVLVSDLKKNSLVGVLVGDSVGHGASVSYMSFALEFSYNSIVAMMNPFLMSPDLIDKSMARAIVKTSKNWKGEPSIITLQLDLEKSVISLINRGMPYPILLKSESGDFITERSSAFSLQQVTSGLSVQHKLEQGQSLFLYSDGFLDLMPEHDLLNLIYKLSNKFKGDSRAIGRNIIRYIQKNSTGKEVTDDVSFLILSKAKRGKNNGT